MKCRYCGQTNFENGRCSSCGASAPAEEPKSATTFCVSCGSPKTHKTPHIYRPFNPETGERVYLYSCSNKDCDESPLHRHYHPVLRKRPWWRGGDVIGPCVCGSSGYSYDY